MGWMQSMQPQGFSAYPFTPGTPTQGMRLSSPLSQPAALSSLSLSNPMQSNQFGYQDIASAVMSIMSSISMALAGLMQVLGGMFQKGNASLLTNNGGIPNNADTGQNNGCQARASAYHRITPSDSQNPAESNDNAASDTSSNSTGNNDTDLYPDQGAQSDASLRKGGCGLIAAMAFLKTEGKDTSLQEVKKLAKQEGFWNNGMKGPDSEYKLLKSLGINASKDDNVNWDKIAQNAQNGKPVILSTPQHYWVVQGYDPKTKKFNFGNSAKALGLKGDKQWMTKEEYTNFVTSAKRRKPGGPTTAFYLNS